MGRVRQVQPEVDVLPISDGDSITVRRRLTYGEDRAYKALYVDVSYETSDDKTVNVVRKQNKTVMFIAKVAAYLVDWTLQGLAGPIPVPETLEGRIAVINTLDTATVDELIGAVAAHEEKYSDPKAPTAETLTTA